MRFCGFGWKDEIMLRLQKQCINKSKSDGGRERKPRVHAEVTCVCLQTQSMKAKRRWRRSGKASLDLGIWIFNNIYRLTFTSRPHENTAPLSADCLLQALESVGPRRVSPFPAAGIFGKKDLQTGALSCHRVLEHASSGSARVSVNAAHWNNNWSLHM